jgi:hypothetical protein
MMTRLPWTCLAVMALALTGAGVMQQRVEQRRVEAHLTWADPQDKEALEIGFMALGGFRGLLADILWFKAQTQQESAQYYNLKLMCELIQKLQPTFTQIHSFQAHNMGYNLANRAESCEDKWFWIVSGIATLERGVERTRQNFSMWFELGWMYFDRLGDEKMGECAALRNRELPNFDELSEEQYDGVFSKPRTWTPGHARPNEQYRFAAYYFWKSIQTRTEMDWTGAQNSIRTERNYGLCLQRLGMWHTTKPVEEWKKWNDGGAEAWYADLRRRNPNDTSTEQLLRWCLYEEIVFYADKTRSAAIAGNVPDAATNKKSTEDAYQRFKNYYPEEKMTIADVIKEFNAQKEKIRKRGQ